MSYKHRIVLIGGSGFIGKNLTALLTGASAKVVSTSSKDLDLADPGAVAQLKSLIQPDDQVVFLSALTPDKGKDTATLMKNLKMAQNLADFVEQTPLAHFTLIGSDAIYRDDINPEPVNESTDCAPSTLYGYMHLGRELILKTSLAKHKTPSLVIRPSAVYGNGDTHNSYGPNRFLRTALKDGKITLFGEGEEARDHIHIDDLCKLIALCIKNKTEGVINATTGVSPSFMQVAQEVKSLIERTQAGANVKIECLPRSSPITYRHFDITNRVKLFPEYQTRSIGTGLSEFLNALKKNNDVAIS